MVTLILCLMILIDFCDPYTGNREEGLHVVRCAFECPCQTLTAHTPAQVKPLLDAVESLAKQGLWCVGYVRYEAARAFDVAMVTHQAEGPLAWFGVFRQALPWPDAVVTDETHLAWRSTLTRHEFDTQLKRIHQAIAAGVAYQVNYTAPLIGDLSGHALHLFERMQRAQSGGYAAFIDTGDEQVLSVSPELFFDWRDGQILTRPMKGTAPRGVTPSDDHMQATGLVQSPKERAENVMIVDLLRNDLSRIALPHSVQVPRLFYVQTLPTLLQMVSDVSASTRPDTTLADVFKALFPCGSVTGAPKVQAMRLIKTLEPKPRGVYCGAIGVVRPGGHATFNVAIRTVILRNQAALCGIGSGITADATADAEWHEWQHKRVFLDRASQSFNLLETLRLQGGVYHHLVAHLARMAGAAVHFGYPYDASRIHLALQELAATVDQAQQAKPDKHADRSQPVWRVRLQLDASGTPLAHADRLKHALTPVQLALATTPFVASHSEFTRYKTTHRAHYEAFAPANPAVFDTLLYNQRGELTECTRGNIAVLLDGQWLTPALHCGLLAGVGRAHFIGLGKIKEAKITLADLPRVQALALMNSLRGWVQATVQIEK